jgi:hypothetical protein
MIPSRISKNVGAASKRSSEIRVQRVLAGMDTNMQNLFLKDRPVIANFAAQNRQLTATAKPVFQN